MLLRARTHLCFLLVAVTSLGSPTQHEDRDHLDGSLVPRASSTGSLPSPSQFKADKGSKWNVTYVSNLTFSGALGAKGLGGDKCRTGQIGNKVIWNCGDMACAANTSCGFSFGPAFYGTSNVSVVNTSTVVNVNDNNFLSPWSGDPVYQSPYDAWGMDTSNVAAVNSTHGVAYGWEIWRSKSGKPAAVDRGNAVAWVTLGTDKPISTRIGPLLTGPDAVHLGTFAILHDGNYIYTYTMQYNNSGNLIIGRVQADQSIFDATKYSFLAQNGSWISGKIPSSDDTTFRARSGNSDGNFGCAAYGSIYYNTYLRKYVLLCSIFEYYVNMYISDTPYGPFSAEYSLSSGNYDPHLKGAYGSHAHPEYGTSNEFYFSIGPDGPFYTFKVTMNY